MLPSAPLVMTIVVGGAGFTNRRVTHSTTISRSTNGTTVSTASRHDTAEMRKRGNSTLGNASRPELEPPGRFYAARSVLTPLIADLPISGPHPIGTGPEANNLKNELGGVR